MSLLLLLLLWVNLLLYVVQCNPINIIINNAKTSKTSKLKRRFLSIISIFHISFFLILFLSHECFLEILIVSVSFLLSYSACLLFHFVHTLLLSLSWSFLWKFHCHGRHRLRRRRRRQVVLCKIWSEALHQFFLFIILRFCRFPFQIRSLVSNVFQLSRGGQTCTCQKLAWSVL